MIRGILFDKDGTLFDFNATWGAWARRFLDEMAQGTETLSVALGELIGFDYASGRFHPESPAIAQTPGDLAALLLPALPGWDAHRLVAHINATAAVAPMVEVLPLVPLLKELRMQGLRLGVATNDSETPARAHLAAVGAEALFDFVAGFDSGFGGKPEPGMCLAFAHSVGLAPRSVAMVGDSRQDLIAGRDAGMHPVAVLSGPAGVDELADLAEAVLPDIAALPGWLAAQRARQATPGV